MLIPRSLSSFVQQCANVFKGFRPLEQIVIYREIALTNMSKCIIKSIKFVLEMVSLSLAYLNCDTKIWFLPHTLRARSSCSY